MVVHRGAQPRDRLAQRYKHFQRRMSNMWLKQCGGVVGESWSAGTPDLAMLTRKDGVATLAENQDNTYRPALQRLAAGVRARDSRDGEAVSSQPVWFPNAKRPSAEMTVFTDDEFHGDAQRVIPPRIPLLDGQQVAGLATEDERRRENIGA